MRPIRVRFRLFFASFALLLIVVLAGGLYLQHSLGTWFLHRVEIEMLRTVRGARVAIRIAPSLDSIAVVDPLADRLGDALAARVTIIDDAGRVIGDSQLTEPEVRDVENHGDRPEVVEARRSGEGVSRRFSDTLQLDMLYVAIPYSRPDGRGVVRVALPLSDLDRLLERLRVLVLFGGLLSIGVAFVSSFLGSYYMDRTLRRLIDRARELTGGRTADAGPGPSGSISGLADELERAVTALAGERDRIEAVLESLSDAVLALDDRQRVTLANHAATELFDLPRSPAGIALSGLVDAPEIADVIAQSRQGRSAWTEYAMPGETPKRVVVRATPMRITGGAVIVFQDVTELRKLERIRQDFVANVSHELRTPISIIRANAETLLDGALDDRDRARDFLGALLHHAERLSQLIADLLDISRMESGRYTLDIHAMPLAPVVRRIVDFIGANAEEKGIRIEPVIDDRAWVRADDKALEHILLNLIDNAIKYTPPGGHVRIVARTLVTQVRVEVADDGAGVPPEHRERLFERFYRVDPGRSREMGGTGLGLAIVKHLVGSMGGRVGMKPNEPRGSIFWVSLPLAEPEEPKRSNPSGLNSDFSAF